MPLRTHFDAWVLEQERRERHSISSDDVRTRLIEAARRRQIDEDMVPSRKGIDDMRGARYYPTHVIALLIHDITAGAIGLEEWVKDFLRFGTRARPRIRR